MMRSICEVALRRGRRADRDRFVGQLDVARVLVGLGIDGDRLDAHAAGGADHSAGDLAPVGDQDLLEHVAASVRWPVAQSGMLPCLRQGFSSFLSRSIASERQIRLRVSCGMITSSM